MQTPKDHKADASRLALDNYLEQIRTNWRWSVPGLLLPGVGSVLVAYIPPLIVGHMITHFKGHIPNTWAEVAPFILLFAGFWLIGEIVFRLAFLALNRADMHGMKNLYIAALQELLRKDASFFNDNFAGSLTKKAMGYGRNFETFMDTLAFNVVGNLLPLFFAVIILATISPYLVITLLSLLLVTLVLVLPQIKKRHRLVKTREVASNVMAGHVADVIGNISAVQAFAHEAEEQKRHEQLIGDYAQKALKTWDFHVLHVDMIVAPFYLLGNTVGLALAILLTNDAKTLASVFVTFSYFLQSTRVLFEFNRIYRNMENSISDAAEFTALILEPPRLLEAQDAQAISVTQGDIVFKDVDFAYPDQPDHYLFQNLNLHIRPGEKVALVGHSGGGKTTITKLLLRIVDIQRGEILIDGQNIANSTFTSLRSSIASVPQDPAMFHRTIFDNIRYGKLNASKAEILAAARGAHALEFIEKLPHQFETLVGERGVKLSGGQRQRIAIARAMVKDAPILVLDEATSALDSASEVLIQDALWKLMDDRTAIVIAHRLSTIQKMDRIIVLENGCVVEQGSHKELLAKKDGTYAKLWAHQSGGFIEE
jgi:ATP-binding cassette subfamily B protein